MKQKFKIGLDKPVYIIAEISGNHQGKIENVLRLIDKCKEIGVDAVKIQTYESQDITINSNKSDFIIKNSSKWKNYKTLWKLYSEAMTPFKWHDKIFNHANKVGINLFSSPFSERAVDLLESLNCNFYKLASPEINHIPLIEKIAKTNKPIIISTGMADEEEINLAIKTFRKISKQPYILLKCNSSYPSPLNKVNLSAISYMQKKYKTIIGLSDHTIGFEIPLASIALGAKVIEKHICLNKKNSVDGFFSLNVKEFSEMIQKIRNIELALGNSKVISYKTDTFGKRSIYFSKDIKKNQIITEDYIKVVRPSKGMHPRYYKTLLGKKVIKNYYKGDRVTYKSVKN